MSILHRLRTLYVLLFEVAYTLKPSQKQTQCGLTFRNGRFITLIPGPGSIRAGRKAAAPSINNENGKPVIQVLQFLTPYTTAMKDLTACIAAAVVVVTAAQYQYFS
jgi:hypothetical protein